MAKILVADDERAICEAFRQFLSIAGHQTLVASTGKEAVECVQRERPDAVFLDVQMPGMSGIEALRLLREEHPDLPVIVMTAYGTMQTAIDAMRAGAFDYVTKPVDLDQIRTTLKRALDSCAPRAASPSTAAPTPGTLIGNSAAMQEVFKLVGLLTTNDFTVLLTGESGVGKEMVAQAIHAYSDRKNRPFVAVNCAAVPESLIESELFGHEKGAFTGAESRRRGRFEQAEDGTLFLDEIGELPLALQGKLLRVLQEKAFERVGGSESNSVHARVITATNRDLVEEIAQGRFREDLYYRLKLITLHIPALRQRRDDIAPLTQHFLTTASAALGRPITAIEPTAAQRLYAHNWPGNVRELEHCIKRAAMVCKGGLISEQDLDLPAMVATRALPDSVSLLRQAASAALRWAHTAELSGTLPDGVFHFLVQEVEHEMVDEALRITDGNQVAAAKLLGLHRTTMRNKRREPGLD